MMADRRPRPKARAAMRAVVQRRIIQGEPLPTCTALGAAAGVSHVTAWTVMRATLAEMEVDVRRTKRGLVVMK